MQTAVCLLPAVPIRKEPSHRSEMISQLLFGEYATIGQEKDDFVFAKCDYDDYEGWVQTKQLTFIQSNEIIQANAYTANFATPVTKAETLFHVPFATPVFAQKELKFSMAGHSFTYLIKPQQTWTPRQLQFSPELLPALCQPYLNAPYLWGGKSLWGTDCSGFVQQVFKLLGIKLLRDAYLQAEQGVLVSSRDDAQAGDLAFFQNEKGKVVHVGIVLTDGKIIHASGEVRIDLINDSGIINAETKKQTHRMNSIRRLIHL